MPYTQEKFSASFSLLILLGIIWGTGYSIARFAVINGVHPLGYSFWQAIGPAIFLICIVAIRKNRFYLSSEHLRYYLICGFTGIVFPNTNMYFAAAHLPAGLLAVVVNTVPIIAYPIALYAGVESFRWLRFFAIVFAVCGIMLIIVPKTSLPSANMMFWILSSLLTPCAFAFCSIYIYRHRPLQGDSLSLAAGTLFAASLLLTPFVFFLHHFYVPHFPLHAQDWVIFLEIILSSIGYILFFQLIKIAGPVYYTLVDTIVSLTGLTWGYVIFHETLNAWTTLAVVSIFIALILIHWSPQKKSLSSPGKTSAT